MLVVFAFFPFDFCQLDVNVADTSASEAYKSILVDIETDKGITRRTKTPSSSQAREFGMFASSIAGTPFEKFCSKVWWF